MSPAFKEPEKLKRAETEVEELKRRMMPRVAVAIGPAALAASAEKRVDDLRRMSQKDVKPMLAAVPRPAIAPAPVLRLSEERITQMRTELQGIVSSHQPKSGMSEAQSVMAQRVVEHANSALQELAKREGRDDLKATREYGIVMQMGTAYARFSDETVPEAMRKRYASIAESLHAGRLEAASAQKAVGALDAAREAGRMADQKIRAEAEKMFLRASELYVKGEDKKADVLALSAIGMERYGMLSARDRARQADQVVALRNAAVRAEVAKDAKEAEAAAKKARDALEPISKAIMQAQAAAARALLPLIGAEARKIAEDAMKRAPELLGQGRFGDAMKVFSAVQELGNALAVRNGLRKQMGVAPKGDYGATEALDALRLYSKAEKDADFAAAGKKLDEAMKKSQPALLTFAAINREAQEARNAARANAEFRQAKVSRQLRRARQSLAKGDMEGANELVRLADVARMKEIGDAAERARKKVSAGMAKNEEAASRAIKAHGEYARYLKQREAAFRDNSVLGKGASAKARSDYSSSEGNAAAIGKFRAKVEETMKKLEDARDRMVRSKEDALDPKKHAQAVTDYNRALSDFNKASELLERQKRYGNFIIGQMETTAAVFATAHRMKPDDFQVHRGMLGADVNFQRALAAATEGRFGSFRLTWDYGGTATCRTGEHDSAAAYLWEGIRGLHASVGSYAKAGTTADSFFYRSAVSQMYMFEASLKGTYNTPQAKRSGVDEGLRLISHQFMVGAEMAFSERRAQIGVLNQNLDALWGAVEAGGSTSCTAQKGAYLTKMYDLWQRRFSDYQVAVQRNNPQAQELAYRSMTQLFKTSESEKGAIDTLLATEDAKLRSAMRPVLENSFRQHWRALAALSIGQNANHKVFDAASLEQTRIFLADIHGDYRSMGKQANQGRYALGNIRAGLDMLHDSCLSIEKRWFDRAFVREAQATAEGRQLAIFEAVHAGMRSGRAALDSAVATAEMIRETSKGPKADQKKVAELSAKILGEKDLLKEQAGVAKFQLVLAKMTLPESEYRKLEAEYQRVQGRPDLQSSYSLIAMIGSAKQQQERALFIKFNADLVLGFIPGYNTIKEAVRPEETVRLSTVALDLLMVGGFAAKGAGLALRGAKLAARTTGAGVETVVKLERAMPTLEALSQTAATGGLVIGAGVGAQGVYEALQQGQGVGQAMLQGLQPVVLAALSHGAMARAKAVAARGGESRLVQPVSELFRRNAEAPKLPQAPAYIPEEAPAKPTYAEMKARAMRDIERRHGPTEKPPTVGEAKTGREAEALRYIERRQAEAERPRAREQLPAREGVPAEGRTGAAIPKALAKARATGQKPEAELQAREGFPAEGKTGAAIPSALAKGKAATPKPDVTVQEPMSIRMKLDAAKGEASYGKAVNAVKAAKEAGVEMKVPMSDLVETYLALDKLKGGLKKSLADYINDYAAAVKSGRTVKSFEAYAYEREGLRAPERAQRVPSREPAFGKMLKEAKEAEAAGAPKVPAREEAGTGAATPRALAKGGPKPAEEAGTGAAIPKAIAAGKPKAVQEAEMPQAVAEGKPRMSEQRLAERTPAPPRQALGDRFADLERQRPMDETWEGAKLAWGKAKAGSVEGAGTFSQGVEGYMRLKEEGVTRKKFKDYVSEYAAEVRSGKFKGSFEDYILYDLTREPARAAAPAGSPAAAAEAVTVTYREAFMRGYRRARAGQKDVTLGTAEGAVGEAGGRMLGAVAEGLKEVRELRLGRRRNAFATEAASRAVEAERVAAQINELTKKLPEEHQGSSRNAYIRAVVKRKASGAELNDAEKAALRIRSLEERRTVLAREFTELRQKAYDTGAGEYRTLTSGERAQRLLDDKRNVDYVIRSRTEGLRREAEGKAPIIPEYKAPGEVRARDVLKALGEGAAEGMRKSTANLKSDALFGVGTIAETGYNVIAGMAEKVRTLRAKARAEREGFRMLTPTEKDAMRRERMDPGVIEGEMNYFRQKSGYTGEPAEYLAIRRQLLGAYGPNARAAAEQYFALHDLYKGDVKAFKADADALSSAIGDMYARRKLSVPKDVSDQIALQMLGSGLGRERLARIVSESPDLPTVATKMETASKVKTSEEVAVKGEITTRAPATPAEIAERTADLKAARYNLDSIERNPKATHAERMEARTEYEKRLVELAKTRPDVPLARVERDGLGYTPPRTAAEGEASGTIQRRFTSRDETERAAALRKAVDDYQKAGGNPADAAALREEAFSGRETTAKKRTARMAAAMELERARRAMEEINAERRGLKRPEAAPKPAEEVTVRAKKPTAPPEAAKAAPAQQYEPRLQHGNKAIADSPLEKILPDKVDRRTAAIRAVSRELDWGARTGKEALPEYRDAAGRLGRTPSPEQILTEAEYHVNKAMGRLPPNTPPPKAAAAPVEIANGSVIRLSAEDARHQMLPENQERLLVRTMSREEAVKAYGPARAEQFLKARHRMVGEPIKINGLDYEVMQPGMANQLTEGYIKVRVGREGTLTVLEIKKKVADARASPAATAKAWAELAEHYNALRAKPHPVFTTGETIPVLPGEARGHLMLTSGERTLIRAQDFEAWLAINYRLLSPAEASALAQGWLRTPITVKGEKYYVALTDNAAALSIRGRGVIRVKVQAQPGGGIALEVLEPVQKALQPEKRKGLLTRAKDALARRREAKRVADIEFRNLYGVDRKEGGILIVKPVSTEEIALTAKTEQQRVSAAAIIGEKWDAAMERKLLERARDSKTEPELIFAGYVRYRKIGGTSALVDYLFENFARTGKPPPAMQAEAKLAKKALAWARGEAAKRASPPAPAQPKAAEAESVILKSAVAKSGMSESEMFATFKPSEIWTHLEQNGVPEAEIVRFMLRNERRIAEGFVKSRMGKDDAELLAAIKSGGERAGLEWLMENGYPDRAAKAILAERGYFDRIQEFADSPRAKKVIAAPAELHPMEAGDLNRAFETLGFKFDRMKGTSHAIYKLEGTDRAVSIPQDRETQVFMIMRLLRQSKTPKADFLKALAK